MKRIKVYMAVAGLLVLPAASATSSSHKHTPPKHKAAHTSLSQKPTVSADSWKPDPALIGSLAKEIQVGGYSFRLPEGYSEVEPSPDVIALRQRGFNSHVYGGRRRSDGTAATFGLTVATPPPGMTGTLSLDDALDGTLAQKKHQWQNFTESATQDGQIDGLTFKRVYFKGLVSGAAGTRMAHGLAYVTTDGKNIISFQAEDAEPYNDETIPIAQAAVLTFHR
jgi:hypothetical protein